MTTSAPPSVCMSGTKPRRRNPVALVRLSLRHLHFTLGEWRLRSCTVPVHNHCHQGVCIYLACVGDDVKISHTARAPSCGGPFLPRPCPLQPSASWSLCSVSRAAGAHCLSTLNNVRHVHTLIMPVRPARSQRQRKRDRCGD